MNITERDMFSSMMDKAEAKTKDCSTFKENYAIVRYKKTHNEPMTTAKQEMMEDFIEDWTDLFGYDSLD